MFPPVAIFIVLVGLSLILAIASLGTRKNLLLAETARKLVHIGMGLLCLLFPLLFHNPLPVWVLSGCAVSSLLVIRATNLKQTIGSSLFSVKRLSIGELLFPISVAWLFTLANGEFILYTISLLLLTLADSAGAITGTRFGKKIYRTAAGQKSIEGSLAFFVTSIVCIFIPLFFQTTLPLTTLFALSCAVALFTTAVEGVSGNGLDNLLIPIGSYLLLDYYLTLSGGELLLRLSILVITLTILLWTHKLHTFDGGATLTALIFSFASATLGGAPCFLACLLVLTRHIILQRKVPQHSVTTHSLGIIVAIAVPTLMWLTLGAREVLPQHLAQIGFICSLSMIISMLHSGSQKYLNKASASLTKGLLLSFCILSTTLLISPLLQVDIKVFFVTISLTPLLSFTYYRWKGTRQDNDNIYWAKLCSLALLGNSSLLILLL